MKYMCPTASFRVNCCPMFSGNKFWPIYGAQKKLDKTQLLRQLNLFQLLHCLLLSAVHCFLFIFLLTRFLIQPGSEADDFLSFCFEVPLESADGAGLVLVDKTEPAVEFLGLPDLGDKCSETNERDVIWFWLSHWSKQTNLYYWWGVGCGKEISTLSSKWDWVI